MNNLLFYERIQELLRTGVSFVQVTMVSVQGSAPQDVGAKALISEKGLEFGTVGGGKVEAEAIRYGQQILRNTGEKTKQLVTWNLQKDIGMTCGGEVCFFFEAHATRPWTIVIFGAGHVAQALIPILVQLDCVVHCIDPREEWLERLEKKSNLFVHCLSDPERSAAIIPDGAFVCLMTQGHSTDVPILKCILGKMSPPYLGMIGSKVKAFRVRTELQKAEFSEERISLLRSPIGLSIGANHPVEIAISISAELLEVRDSQR